MGNDGSVERYKSAARAMSVLSKQAVGRACPAYGFADNVRAKPVHQSSTERCERACCMHAAAGAAG